MQYRCLFFHRLKINHDPHEFILEPGTVANTYGNVLGVLLRNSPKGLKKSLSSTVSAIYIGAAKSIGAALFAAILEHLKKTFSTFF